MTQFRRLRETLDDGDITGIQYGDVAKDFAAIFLHATGFNALTYQSILAPLSERARIAALDLRGHGGNTLPADPQTLTGWGVMRDDVIAFLERKAPKGTVLVGHSMGATVALLVAAKRPELVRALILVEPVILLPGKYRSMFTVPGAVALQRATQTLSREATKRRATFESKEAAITHFTGRGAYKTWRDPFLADFVEDGIVEDEAGGFRLACRPAWEAACYAAQRHRPWQALHRARCDITILRAPVGSTVSDSVLRLILQKRPLTVVETVRGSTHFLPMEVPYAVRDQLSEMISRHIEGFAPGEVSPVRRSLSGS